VILPGPRILSAPNEGTSLVRQLRHLVLVGALALIGGLLAPAGPARADDPYNVKFIDLTAGDGIKLGANIVTPTTPGKHPLIVLPGSWGGGDTQNLIWSTNLAKRGMIAINYATRGAADSGGVVDFAGPEDTADVESVINWALANTQADPARIGLAGISYAGPIMLNAAAADPRIKAVAMTSGLTDIEQMLIPNDTRYGLLALGFRGTAAITAHTDADFQSRLDDFFANRNMTALRAWAADRSPIHKIDQINKNGTAILMTQAWNDSVARVGQNMRFYNQLTTPKQTEFYPGEHASTEVTGVLGLPSEVFDAVYKWLDVYVNGTESADTIGPAVRLRPRTPDRAGAVETYPDLAAFEAPATRFDLGQPTGLLKTGTLTTGSATSTWSDPITTNQTTSDAGITMGTYTLEALTGRPPTVWLPGVSRDSAGVWQGEPLTAGAKIRGTVKMHLTVVPKAATGSVFGYLYEVDGAGTGELINYAPYTWEGATPGKPLAVDVDFDPNSFDVPAGRRLAFVVDGKDVMYIDANGEGDKMTFLSPSSIDIPLRP
jgi:putative CocE/NonD family hydrolase